MRPVSDALELVLDSGALPRRRLTAAPCRSIPKRSLESVRGETSSPAREARSYPSAERRSSDPYRGGTDMKILVSGSSGLVGSVLVPLLSTRGHSITRLVRQDPQPGQVQWDPERGTIEAARLAGFDAVVHLAGQNIAAGRWTPEQKARIRVSRVKGTRILAGALAALPAPPPILMCASALGSYGDRGYEGLHRECASGS